jgi:conjugal transfer mating pair stabilization protein TraG
MIEIFTVGGGEYIVNVLKAVASLDGAGGYKSLIQVTMVMGLALAVIVLAFNQDWRAWLNWFLGATLIYMCLMVPRMDVHVTDRVNPSLAPANVATCRFGLALMASFTSQVGDYLTRSAELVFGLPDDLNYSKNGMIYGARLYEATRSLRISDPEFAANLDEHVRQCVFYDLLLGRYSMKQLAESDDIWATIAPGSAGAGPEVPDRDRPMTA